MKIIHFLFCGMFSMSLFAQTSDCKPVLVQDGKESAYPRLSIDGKKILFQTNQTGHWQIAIYNMDTKLQTRVTNDTANNNFADWSPDNRWIAFVSDRDGNEEIYLVKPDGSGLQRITNDPGRDIHPYFSPDGKYLLFNSTRYNGSFDIFRYTIATGKTEQLTSALQDETCARYSPDMKTIVYLKNDQQSDDVFILDLSNFLSTNLTNTPRSVDGWPMFSNDGKWIYFSSMENGTYSIYKIKTDGTDRKQLTFATKEEEHARVYIAPDEKRMVYNILKSGTIGIYLCYLTT
jgi:Tol biopolymer transport system component